MARQSNSLRSLQQSFYRFYFNFFGKLFPRKAALHAANLWRRTHRFSMPKREQEWSRSATDSFVEVNGQTIYCQQWGTEGPVILLVHGWNGRGAQLASMVDPLLKKGFQILAFDAPGHGQSDGESASLLEFLKTIQTLEAQRGPFHAMIGHSFGSMAIQVALQQGVKSNCCVLIAGPESVRWLADRFTQYIDLAKTALPHFEQIFEERYGADSWETLSPDSYVSKQTIPALFIHDRQDRDVPFSQSEGLAEQWPVSELLLTDALGHRRILRSKIVIEASCRFIDRHRASL